MEEEEKMPVEIGKIQLKLLTKIHLVPYTILN